MSLPSVIAVDGPAGSGKSTVSAQLAERLGYLFIDTGVFYRTVTLVVLRSDIPLNDIDAMVTHARTTDIQIRPEPEDDLRQYSVWIGNEDVTDQLRTSQVEAYVSTVSAIPEVREVLVEIQRKIATQGQIIMAGRDIGTVVLPDADMKFYIDASLEERARRRHKQKRETGEHVNLSQIEDGLRQRDKEDSEREVSPLRQADDAIYIATDEISIEAVVDKIVCHMQAQEQT